MIFWQCSYCEASLRSDEQRQEHEIICPKNPENQKMTSAHFKKRMELNKKRENKG